MYVIYKITIHDMSDSFLEENHGNRDRYGDTYLILFVVLFLCTLSKRNGVTEHDSRSDDTKSFRNLRSLRISDSYGPSVV